MEKIYKTISSGILFLFITHLSFAQWQTNGPYGGPVHSSAAISGKVFIGTDNGVFSSSDDGMLWSASNTGIERTPIIALASNGVNLYAGSTSSGVFLSADNGTTWNISNSGITTMSITSLFSADSIVYAGTPNGVFFSSNNGTNWSLRNTGIPVTYEIYCFAQMGDTVFGGSYGMGLFQTNNDGMSWTTVSNGFPANVFVYALITDGNNIYAGTNGGIYKSSDRGSSWFPSNIGFPPGMWAESFAIKTGIIFAGTYSEGIFVSSNGGATWSAVNFGIPNLPFPTGLPNNYPSVEDIIISGSNVIASTVNGVYATSSDGASWFESNPGVLATDILCVSANSTMAFAGSERTGIYISSNAGASWSRSNSGLTSYNINSMAIKGSSVFVSASYQDVFRSDDNGSTWISASSGLTSPAAELKADSTRVLAITTGAISMPSGLFQTVDNGLNWTEIPTTFSSMSTVSYTSTKLYVGTYGGIIYYSNDNGLTWSGISAGLPPIKISAILISGTDLFAGTDGSGVYKSIDNGMSWNLVGPGITNVYITDLRQQGGVIYASTWGSGVFVSGDAGASWSSYNGLGNEYVRKLSVETAKVYAATDAGVYTAPLATTGIQGNNPGDVDVYPNPGNGLINLVVEPNQKISVTVNDIAGTVIYRWEGYSGALSRIDLSTVAKGIYLMRLQTEKGITRRKIIVQ